MRMRKSVKLVIFNVAFIIISILCFSDHLLGLGFDPGLGAPKFAFSIILAIFGTIMFLFGNYMIITMPDKINYKIENLESIDDCIGALYYFMRTDHSFKTEISKTIEQLKTLQRRKASLMLLLDQNGVSENFKSLHQTAHKAEFFAMNNAKNIISRLIVFDNKEYDSDPANVDIESHKKYICEKIESTQLILKEYSELLVAFTAIGDTHHVDLDEIRDMTEALNRVLKKDEFNEKEYLNTQQQSSQ